LVEYYGDCWLVGESVGTEFSGIGLGGSEVFWTREEGIGLACRVVERFWVVADIRARVVRDLLGIGPLVQLFLLGLRCREFD